MSSSEIASARSSLEVPSVLTRAETKNDSLYSTPSRTMTDPPSNTKSPAIATSPRQGHQKLVFSDPVAFRYLEEDPATIVLERRRRLEGFEIYVVEQWACSRIQPTFVITTYTGDTSHSILVGVLSVPVDESTWSKRLQVYFKAVSQFHARKMETPLGLVMVTNLSSFPSSLVVFPVPDGDIKKHREDFIVNENLKRLGCSGRAAMNLQAPQASTIAKFHQLYRTSESVPVYPAVMELVKLCQTALIIYGKLPPAYADGLLCDITEKAIAEWWTDIGTYFFNIEPSDGILGPTTVAALLGLLMGAFNRLKASGASVGKDVLDMLMMKRAIGTFQRTQKLEKTRRLDRQTLERLHQTTAKSARNEGWTVPKAVKSTVAELSGKGGEMVMGIVGSRDKAGIAEVETLDLDRMAQLVSGSKMKWLWQGKPIKSAAADSFGRPSDELNGRVFSSDDQGNFMWTSDKRDSIFDATMARRLDAYNDKAPEEKRFGRLRDAVAGRPHQSKHRQDEDGDHIESQAQPITHVDSTTSYHSAKDKSDHKLGPPTPAADVPPPFNLALRAEPVKPRPQLRRTTSERTARQSQPGSLLQGGKSREQDPHPEPKGRRSRVDAIHEELKSGVYQEFSSVVHYSGPQAKILRRSRSAVLLLPLQVGNPRVNRIGRHMSFSMVEAGILTYKDVVTDDTEDEIKQIQPAAALSAVQAAATSAQKKSRTLQNLQQTTVPFTQSMVDTVESLDGGLRQHLEELNTLYYQRLEEYQALRATSTDLVVDERAALTESLRRVEILGAKLDYEISSLQSRLQEVEDGVGEFERNVVDTEGRVKELVGMRGVDEMYARNKGWGNWLIHLGGYL